MLLNITHQGQSRDFDLGDVTLIDDDVRRIAVELIGEGDFTLYVVDRMPDNKVYLRPKVPFGSMQ